MNPLVRRVNRDLLDALDPLERIIAEKFLRDGRWQLIDSPQQVVESCR